MDVHNGDTLVFAVDNMTRIWTVSKIDGNVVKFFEQDGSYRQMPYTYLVEMLERGYIKVDAPTMAW